MASRYPKHKSFDYCYHPVRIVQDGEVNYFPCGKCDGCLLHSANKWSMRLQTEIESTKFAIKCTPTYNNEFLPVLLQDVSWFKVSSKKCFPPFDYPVKGDWTSQNPYNYRLSVHLDENLNFFYDKVSRVDDLCIDGVYDSVEVTNCRLRCLPYLSKRDYQLYLKSIRNDIYKRFGLTNVVRYFCAAEYGETKYRPHAHFIFLTNNYEVAEYLVHVGLYANWKMCDKTRFDEYCAYCDSGYSGYLTNYVNSITILPKVYSENKQIKPFRLCSKSNAIGYNCFDLKTVQEKISVGDFEFTKRIERIGSEYILRYPSDYLRSVFPKCYQYGKRDSYQLRRYYGVLFDFVERFSYPLETCVRRLRKVLRPSDYQATSRCFRFCREFGSSPEYFIFLVDQVDYKLAMYALRMQYEYYESKGFNYITAQYYNNFSSLVADFCSAYRSGVDTYKMSDSMLTALALFIQPLGFELDDLFDLPIDCAAECTFDKDYACEVSDILAGLVKMPKFLEKAGLSPVDNIY